MRQRDGGGSVGDAGVYCLVLRLGRARWLTAGRHGEKRLAPGWYVYTGSAKRSLTTRLGRHVASEKRLRWHIDFLRVVTRVEEIWVWPWSRGAECALNGRVQRLRGATVPWRGFGSSDCRCGSHLTHFHTKPRWLGHGAPAWVVRVAERCRMRGGPHLTDTSNGRILRSALGTARQRSCRDNREGHQKGRGGRAGRARGHVPVLASSGQ